MKVFRILIQYGITPVFLGLAVINFILESHGAGHGMHTASVPAPVPGFMPVDSEMGMMHANPLTSMWLMYVLMGLAHISPWLSKKKPTNTAL
jgi:hypothetical protein